MEIIKILKIKEPKPGDTVTIGNMRATFRDKRKPRPHRVFKTNVTRVIQSKQTTIQKVREIRKLLRKS